MTMTLIILGRQPKIGLAELESIYGAKNVRPAGTHSALVDSPVELNQLGGSLKAARVLAEIPHTNWVQLASYLTNDLPHYLRDLPTGKLKLGLSVYGLNISNSQLFRTGLELKKAARASGRSARIIPNTSPALNSAQVLHNQLTGQLGLELVLVKDGSKTWLGQTTSVQDVDDYARRDYGRPKRDAFVGMLPPKLAQTMINLAQPAQKATILDPFCGTGVVLQEALLTGHPVYGTDLQQKMVDYTNENIQWLNKLYPIKQAFKVEQADATDYNWRPTVDTVVCETYLGQPLSGLPSPEKLQEIMANSNTIIEKFLRNIKSQLKTGSRHCLAVPAWRVNGAFKHLPVIDRLEEIGYNRVRFQHASWQDLIYHRENQIVARELLVITVKE